MSLVDELQAMEDDLNEIEFDIVLGDMIKVTGFQNGKTFMVKYPARGPCMREEAEASITKMHSIRNISMKLGC